MGDFASGPWYMQVVLDEEAEAAENQSVRLRERCVCSCMVEGRSAATAVLTPGKSISSIISRVYAGDS